MKSFNFFEFKYFGKNKEYKVNKTFFQFGLLIIFGFLFFVAFHFDFNMNYYSCEVFSNPTYLCKNPFYSAPTWENQEFLVPGEYGMKPNFLFKMVYWFPALTLFIITIVNHLLYNRGLKLEIDGEEK